MHKVMAIPSQRFACVAKGICEFMFQCELHLRQSHVLTLHFLLYVYTRVPNRKNKEEEKEECRVSEATSNESLTDDDSLLLHRTLPYCACPLVHFTTAVKNVFFCARQVRQTRMALLIHSPLYKGMKCDSDLLSPFYIQLSSGSDMLRTGLLKFPTSAQHVIRCTTAPSDVFRRFQIGKFLSRRSR